MWFFGVGYRKRFLPCHVFLASVLVSTTLPKRWMKTAVKAWLALAECAKMSWTESQRHSAHGSRWGAVKWTVYSVLTQDYLWDSLRKVVKIVSLTALRGRDSKLSTQTKTTYYPPLMCSVLLVKRRLLLFCLSCKCSELFSSHRQKERKHKNRRLVWHASRQSAEAN